MARSRITVFLVLSSLQAIAVEKVCREGSGEVFIINASKVRLRVDRDVHIFELRADSWIGWARAYRRLASTLRELARGYAQIDVGIPHAYHLVANHLLNEVLTGALVCLPDGALNLMPINVKRHHRRKMHLRAWLAPLLGMHYRPYEGRLTGFGNHRVNRAYSFFRSEFLPDAEEISLLQIQQSNDLDMDSCLILDQRLASMIGTGECLDRIREGIHRESVRFSRVIHKLHPNQVTGELAISGNSLPDDLSERPVEEVFDQLRPGAVLGVASSALFTLKVANPELDCVAVGLNLVETARPEFRYFRHALREVGARFVDL